VLVCYGQGYPTDSNTIERNAGAPQIALVCKKLVVSFMTDEEKLEGMWHRNAYLKIITSSDKGVTWGNKLMITAKPAAWAGLLAVNDTDFLVICDYEDSNEARHVALAYLIVYKLNLAPWLIISHFAGST
jgi:hypothetical protein